MTEQELQEIEAGAAPASEGHSLPGEFVVWVANDARYVLALVAEVRRLRASAVAGWRAAMIGLGQGDEPLYLEAREALRALGVET